MSLPPLVFGTAGHVDHGKTSLVRAMTGIDLDTLPEERERGITISLGFAPLKLPSGRLAGLVDVPGHERLVRTMVAGASGMDAVMLCVSADDGVMPQTREHLAILDLLGVKTGLVVLTKVDQVDPELLELAMDEVREQVRGTFLEGAPVMATSALTGQGIPELLAALDTIRPPPRDLQKPFRLPVDRSFARKGFGTVVTGTAWSGRLVDGAEVEVLPSHQRARVRGIQVHKEQVGAVEAGSRTALNLSGLEVADVPRGSWVCTPGCMPDTRVIDARYQHLGDAPILEGDQRVVVLLGTREAPARMMPLDREDLEPGASLLVQLRLAEPLPCLAGDRFVVRRESPARTLGGGVVLDPYAPVVRRVRAEAASEQLERLEEGDEQAWLERGGPGGLSEAEVRARFGELRGMRLGDRYFASSILENHRKTLHEHLQRLHREMPLASGHNRKSLKSSTLMALGEREYLALLQEEVREGRLEEDGARVREPGWKVELTPAQEAWRQQALAFLEAAGWEGTDKLREALPAPEALLFLLRDRGDAELVGDRFYAGTVLAKLVEQVGVWFDSHPTLDPAAFKELFGLTRKTAIPLLEWLDQKGITRRQGDVRVRR